MIWLLSPLLGCSSDTPQLLDVPTAPTGDTATLVEPTPMDPGDAMVPSCESPACVDVLFVVDSSRSMDDTQQQLAQSADGFFETLGEIDFHVGATSMDVTNPWTAGTLSSALGENFLTPATPDPVAAFADMVQLGTGGASEESGIGAAYLMTFVKTQDPRNAGFRRAGSPLHLVFVSDEDDQTDEGLRQEATEAFASEPGTRAHALVALTFTPGTRYVALAETLGGTTAALETADFEAFLDAIALAIVAD